MRTLESFSQDGDTQAARTLEEMEAVEARETVPVAEAAPAPGEGLVVQEVEMKGFMRYLHPTDPPITFPETFTAITGPTGAGKTTILDAITFALYKRTTRTDRNATIGDLCREGGHVQVAFRQGGAEYAVKRGIASNGQSYLEVHREGSSLRGTIPELESLIQDIVGLDYDGFRNSTFVRQEEMKQLGADSPAQRLEVFQKLFRLETFERAAAKAKERLDTLRGEIRGTEGEVSVLREQVAALPGRRDEVETLAKRVVDERERLEAAEGRLKTLQEEVAGREARHEDYLRAQASLKEHRKALEELTRRLGARRESLEELPDLQARTETIAREVAALREQAEELKGWEEKEREYALRTKDLEAHRDRMKDRERDARDRIARLKAKREEAAERLEALSADRGAEEAFDLLRREGGLEERLRRIEREREWLADRADLLERLEAEASESRESLDAVRAKTETITPDTFLYGEIQERIQELEEELRTRQEAWETERADLEARRAELEAARDEVGFEPEDRKRLEELRRRVRTLPEMEETLQEARKRLGRLEDLEERIQEMEAERGRLAETVEEARAAVAAGEEAEAAYVEARERLETLRSKRDQAYQALSDVQAAHEAAAGRVEELEELRTRLDEAEGTLEDLRSEAEVLTVLRDGVFHRKGVVMYAINRLLPELEIETTRNLDDLTEGRLRRVRLETVEEAGTYGVRILVEGVDGEWHDVAVFSGGERTQINAALRFAIAKELASMPQVGRTYGRMKTLFIDEGDLGSLDTERSRELFVAKLFKMGAFFEKVVLITHLGEVAERFPGRIRVSMTPDGESRAEVVA